MRFAQPQQKLGVVNNKGKKRAQQPLPPAFPKRKNPESIWGRTLHEDVGPKERGYRLKVQAARAVGYRETLLMQLNAVVLHWDPKKRHTTNHVRLLRNLGLELRSAGVRCVEKIVAWCLNESPKDAERPTPFFWNGKDYLLKMADDLDFVVDALGHQAWDIASFAKGNPLLLSKDDIDAWKKKTTGLPHIGRLQAAMVIISDVVRRHNTLSTPSVTTVSTGKKVSALQEKLEAASELYGAPASPRNNDKKRRSKDEKPTPPATKKSPRGQRGYRSAAFSESPYSQPQRSPRTKPHRTSALGVEENRFSQLSPEKIARTHFPFPTDHGPVVDDEAAVVAEKDIPDHIPDDDIPDHVSDVPSDERTVADRTNLDNDDDDDYSTDHEHDFEEDVDTVQTPAKTAGGVVEDEIEEPMDDDDDALDDSTYEEPKAIDAEASVMESPPPQQDDQTATTGPTAYSLDRLLGEGAYGEVFRGTQRGTGTQCAIKKLKLTADGDDEDEEMAKYAVVTAEREAQLLRDIASHVNVVEFKDSWVEAVAVLGGSVKVDAPVLVFELLAMTALEALELQDDGFDVTTCEAFVGDLCAALAHIHALHIVHRDVKPENVLLTAAPLADQPLPTLKLCDFGAARILPNNNNGSTTESKDLTHYIGSRWYRAPEMMAGSTRYGCLVDVWSAACILAEFATGDPLFSGDDEHGVLALIARTIGPLPRKIVATLVDHGVPMRAIVPERSAIGKLDDAYDGALKAKLGSVELLAKMLHPDPSLRISAEDAMRQLRRQRPPPPVLDVNSLPCWSVPGVESLRKAWSSVLKAGVDATEAQGEAAVPGLDVFGPAAEQLIKIPAPAAEAWLGALIVDPSTPPGALRAVLRCLRWTVDVAIAPRVTACRDWLLAQQQRGEITLLQAVQAVEDQVGPVDTDAASRASVAARLLQSANVALFHRRLAIHDHLAAPDVTSDDPAKEPDHGAGSDVGARVVKESDLRGAIEERLHVRSVNEALALVTPMLVDAEVEAAAKAEGVKRLEALLGLPSLRDHAALLRPASKAALLYVALARRPIQRLNLVTSRTDAWTECEQLLRRQTTCLDDAGAKAVAEVIDIISVGDRTPKQLDFDRDSDDDKPSLVLCPYYRAAFGQKYVDGVAVEEGEGLGPRKELFALLAETARCDWRLLSSDGYVVAPRSKEDATNVLRLRWTEAEPKLATGHVVAIDLPLKDDDALELVVEQILSTSDGVHVVRVSTSSPDLRRAASKSSIPDLLASLVGQTAAVRVRTQPLVVGSDLWLNSALSRTETSGRRLAMLGFLFGAAVANQCQLPLELPPLFFSALGVDNNDAEHPLPGLVGRLLMTSSGKVDEKMLDRLDPSYATTLESTLKMDDASFAAMLELDGLTATMAQDPIMSFLNVDEKDDIGQRRRHLYAMRTSMQRCFETMEWQLRCVRRGFDRAMPRRVRSAVGPSAYDVQRIVCGAPELNGDFKFRETFRVVVDTELRDCDTLHDALWAVVDGPGPESLDATQRRKLLRFITGVDRLPARNTEFLTIELPFMPLGIDEHRRMLAMVPQSHTCDNILELPNYWVALLKTRSADDPAPTKGTPAYAALEDDLRHILKTKLIIALENSTGYGLDAIEPSSGDPHAPDDDRKPPSRSRQNDGQNKDDDDDDDVSIPSIPALDDDGDNNQPPVDQASSSPPPPTEHTMTSENSPRLHEASHDDDPVTLEFATDSNVKKNKDEDDYGSDDFDFDDVELAEE